MLFVICEIFSAKHLSFGMLSISQFRTTHVITITAGGSKVRLHAARQHNQSIKTSQVKSSQVESSRVKAPRYMRWQILVPEISRGALPAR